MSVLLQMEGIDKSFADVKVLQNVRFDLKAGEVHALLGENGAGKSTLIKILGGVYTKNAGTITIEGKEAHIRDVESARKYGISIIHQELMLSLDMSVAENIFVGRELKTKLGLVDMARMEAEAQKMLDGFNLDIRADEIIGNLNIAQRQMVEIVRAISFGAKIIVMDEPTSSLSETEVDMLFDAVRRLKASGVGIIYISHRMGELDIVADRVTVLRDGLYIDTVNMKETTHDHLIALMVGRDLTSFYVKNDHCTDEVILEVDHLKSGKMVRDVSFKLRKGEVLGFGGLVGAGRSEAMECIFGLRKVEGGTIKLDGKPVEIKNVREAIHLGFGMLTEDRKLQGIFPVQSLVHNASIDSMDRFLKHGRYNPDIEYEITRKYIDEVMETKYASLEQPIAALSGGNQQKVLLSRWLLCTKRIFIMDEPTRGIDVKTKTEIYRLIDQLTADGLTVILISSELPELIAMSDRIVVMSNGHTTGTLERDEFSQETIMKYATMEK